MSAIEPEDREVVFKRELPSAEAAEAGDVLTLDEAKRPGWESPSGGSQPAYTASVTVPFNDPNIGTGVDTGYVSAPGSSAFLALVTITSPFDTGAVTIANESGLAITYGTIDATVSGQFSVLVQPQFQAGNLPDPTTITVKVSGGPSQGSLTVRVPYFDAP